MASNKKEGDNWPLSGHENDGLSQYGGRDLIGYAGHPPHTPLWPHKAKVALNFVINYEEGSEKCVLHGDEESEKLLSEIVGAQAYPNERHVNMESLYEYGSRAGFWRLLSIFEKKKIPATVFAVGMALERNPAVCQALNLKKDWEVASHGYRWIDYQNVDEDTEREHIRRTVAIHEKMLGKRPAGIYQGKPNANTRRLVVEEGGFKYDSDSYADDLPYWTLEYEDKPHLIIPYILSENDMRFTSPSNFATGSEFAKYLKENLAALVEEGRAGSPKMMSVGLHCRLMRPGRAAGLAEFIDYAKSFRKDVWICTREEIADFWYENHYPLGRGSPMKTDEEKDVETEEKGSERSSDDDVGAPEPPEKPKPKMLEMALDSISLEDPKSENDASKK